MQKQVLIEAVAAEAGVSKSAVEETPSAVIHTIYWSTHEGRPVSSRELPQGLREPERQLRVDYCRPLWATVSGQQASFASVSLLTFRRRLSARKRSLYSPG
jgi:hypothetical protein